MLHRSVEQQREIAAGVYANRCHLIRNILPSTDFLEPVSILLIVEQIKSLPGESE